MVQLFMCGCTLTNLKRKVKNYKKEEPQLRKMRVEAPGLVRVTGFEPAASSSQNWRATNCATPGNIKFIISQINK